MSYRFQKRWLMPFNIFLFFNLYIEYAVSIYADL